MKTVWVSAAALVDRDGRVLLAQRPQGKAMQGLWEFPGGKMEPGELPEQALIRELHEELGITVCKPCLNAAGFVSYAYRHAQPYDPDCDCPQDDPYFMPAAQLGLKEEFHLLMLLYVCRKWEGVPHAREGQALAWKTPAQMRDLPMPPADRPLVTTLAELVYGNSAPMH